MRGQLRELAREVGPLLAPREKEEQHGLSEESDSIAASTVQDALDEATRS